MYIIDYIANGINGNIVLQRGSVDNVGAARYSLQQNEPDDFVTKLQTVLIMLGFWVGLPDGAFGSKTKNGVREFQAVNGLKDDGIVGKKTFKKLMDYFKTYDKQAKVFSQQCKILPIPFYSQGDPKWGKKILGKNKTLQQAGCLVTCLSMIGAYKLNKANFTPGLLDAEIDAVNGYSGDSVIWDKVMPIIGCTYSGKKSFNDNIIKDYIECNKPVITRVDYGIDGDLQYNHFILIIGIIPGNYVVHDPATRLGNGLAYLNTNILSGITRKGGYNPVFIDTYEVT